MTGPLEFFSLRLVYTEPPAIHQLYFRFPCLGTGTYRGLCTGKLWFSVSFTCWSLKFGGQLFALWLHFSEGSKKSCWLFSLFRFLFIVRTEWWLQASHMLDLKVEVSCTGFWSSLCLLRAVWELYSSTAFLLLNYYNMVYHNVLAFIWHEKINKTSLLCSFLHH